MGTQRTKSTNAVLEDAMKSARYWKKRAKRAEAQRDQIRKAADELAGAMLWFSTWPYVPAQHRERAVIALRAYRASLPESEGSE